MLTVEELELMDDSAHVTGRAKALEWARRSKKQDLAAEMLELGDRIVERRQAVAYYAQTVRWFRQNPSVASIPHPDFGFLKRHEAEQNLTISRMRHGRLCKRLGELCQLLAAAPTYEHAVARHVTTADGIAAPANSDRSVSAA